MLIRKEEKKIWIPTMIEGGGQHGQPLLGQRAEAAIDPDPGDHGRHDQTRQT